MLGCVFTVNCVFLFFGVLIFGECSYKFAFSGVRLVGLSIDNYWG